MLTNEQIQYLDQFCRKKGIRYYDLRAEMTDHLAEGIEAKRNENPNLSFEEALAAVYKSFGIFGFSKVIEEREASIRKTTRRLEWRLFKEYFTVPKLAVTLLIFLTLNSPLLLTSISPVAIFSGYMILFFGAGIGLILYNIKQFHAPKERVLLLRSVSHYSILGILFQIPNLYYNFVIRAFEIDINHNKTAALAMSGFCVLMLLVCLAKNHAYRILYTKAKDDYPLLFE